MASSASARCCAAHAARRSGPLVLAGLRRGRGDEVEHGQGQVGVAVLLDRRREVTQHGGTPRTPARR